MEKSSDDWILDEWEYLPDQKVKLMEKNDLGGGETKQEVVDPLLLKEPLAAKLQGDDWWEPEAPIKFKDIGVVPAPFINDQEAPRSPKLRNDGMEPLVVDVEQEECTEEDKQQAVADHADHVVKGEKPCLERIGFDLWKWRMGGFGALCSVGVAAATICIFLFSGKQGQQQRKMQFQIFADDKGERIKQVVQQASVLNQAMSAARGSPSLARASITFGGYYDGL